MSDNKFKNIVELYEFTRADAANILIKNGTHRMLDIKQGTDDSGQPSPVYIVGKIDPQSLIDNWDEEEPIMPIFPD